MSETYATDDELRAASEAGEVRGRLVDALVEEIRAHRSAAFGAYVKALRIHTAESDLMRAQLQSLKVLADCMRLDGNDTEAAALAGIDSILRAKLDDDGLLVDAPGRKEPA